jgi:DNA invertase Pin-like site-specific DNA recombinase
MRAGDSLVVWKLDRLARSTRQLIDTVEDLGRREIGFRCVTQDIDTATAGGRLVFQIFAALSEFEREIIRERTNAGLEAARARGRRGGRPPAMKPRDLVVAETLLANPDLSVEDVAAQIGVSVATLYRHLPGGRGGVRTRQA